MILHDAWDLPIVRFDCLPGDLPRHLRDQRHNVTVHNIELTAHDNVATDTAGERLARLGDVHTFVRRFAKRDELAVDAA